MTERAEVYGRCILRVCRISAATIVCAPLVFGSLHAAIPPSADPVTVAAQQPQRAIEEQPKGSIPLNPADFAKVEGYYQYADYRFYQFADFPVVARVYRTGYRYYVQDTGQTPIELLPLSFDETYGKFSISLGPKQYFFVMGPDGRARAMVTVRLNQVQDQAPRVSKADWDHAAAKLDQRVRAKKPSAGTENALRRQLESWERKQPGNDRLPYNADSGSRETPEEFAKLIARLGSLVGLRFVKVNQQGWDVFEASFATGKLEFSVAPLSPNGNLAGENYRLL